MRYFVTGTTGFVGGEVARQLVTAGHQVVAVVRDPSKARELQDLGVDLRPGNVAVKETMRASMDGVDGVFHIAAWYRIGRKGREAAYPTNVIGTRNVLELMKELGIPRGVYTSTLAVFSDTKGKLVEETYRHVGPWLSTYDRTKWQAHYEVAEPMIREGLPLMIVMPGVVYGPGDTSWLRPLLVRYLEGRLRTVPRGLAICLSYIEDTARAHILAMEAGRPGETYIIAGPPHKLLDVFEAAERITGIPAPRFHPSPTFLRFLAALSRSEFLRVAAGVTYLGSNAKARRELGYDPRSLDEGLRATLDHEKSLLGSRMAA